MKATTFPCSRTPDNDGSNTPIFVWRMRRWYLFLTSVYGLCWRKVSVLLHPRVRRLWNDLWFENGPKYPRNTNVSRRIISKEDLWRLLRLRKAILKNWGYRKILMYISFYSAYFFVIYVCFELLIKQKEVQCLSANTVSRPVIVVRERTTSFHAQLLLIYSWQRQEAILSKYVETSSTLIQFSRFFLTKDC